MDESPPDSTPAEPSTPTRRPNVMPSRATRAGAGMSAVGGLGALVGFFLPWLIFEAIIQTSCRIQVVQVELYNLYGIAVTLGNAGEAASALAFVALLCVIAIITIAVMSARRPRLFRIRLLLLASLVGLAALGLLGAFAASGQVALIGKNLYGTFLGFGLGFWVTTGSLAVALVGGAMLHAAARPRRRGAPIGEIALALLGIVGLLSSTAAAIIVRPAQYPLPTCVNQRNASHSGGGPVYFTSADSVYAVDAASGRLQWRCRNPLDGVVTDGAPSLADGKLFVASRDGYVYAIRADNAAILWHADVGGRNPYAWQVSRSAPIVEDGLVFGINGSGQVYALRESDGARAWTSIWKAVRWTTPTLLQADGALVYYADDGGIRHLIALDERTGMSMWKSRDISTEPSRPTVGVSMMVDNGVVYDVEKSDEVYLVARSVRDGVTLWRHFLSPLGSQEVRSGFTVADGVVYLDQRTTPVSRYVVADEWTPSVVALRASDGALIWSTLAPDVVSGPASQQVQSARNGQAQITVATESGRVFVAVSPPGAILMTVYGFDAQHGAVLWRNDFASATAPSNTDVYGQPNLVASGDALYLLDPSGPVAALDARAGSILWQVNSAPLSASWTTVPGALATGAAPVDGSTSGLLYVATSKVYAINQTNGAVRWQFTPDKPMTLDVLPQGGYLPLVPSPIISPPTLAP